MKIRLINPKRIKIIWDETVCFIKMIIYSFRLTEKVILINKCDYIDGLKKIGMISCLDSYVGKGESGIGNTYLKQKKHSIKKHC